MEMEENDENKTVATKRKSDSLHETESKKPKRFAVKEFRKCLQSSESSKIVEAIQLFLDVITKNSDHKCILEYLEKGGNCIEILQALEKCSELFPLQVFELVYRILLRINMDYPRYRNVGHDTCRYLLNTYIPLVNKMLSLSSSGKERKTALKLLTAVVTFSATLAKDILLNVNFNLTNIELLTKNTGESDSVRDSFIHFLSAYLIDGHYATLSVLLEKKGLLTSIISGLKFDMCDTVCIILAAIKNHILENSAVSKTAKMKVFNTQVVKDIVNLYNWKGPAGIQIDKKKTVTKIVVDEYEKSKVNQAVHDFLLVLCTSHKHGIIFRDHTLGTGKEHQNHLIFTVLESLERPWEHSYARELVVKICYACPDLTKSMWNKLKEFLIPRPSTKWLNTLKFAISLVKELQPSCMEFCVSKMSTSQVCQALTQLLIPSPIVKLLLVENKLANQLKVVRYHIFQLFSTMFEVLNVHIQTYKDWLSPNDLKILQKYFQDYTFKHLPNVNTLLMNWCTEGKDEEAEISCTTLDLLRATFNFLDSYKTMCPQILNTFNVNEIDIEVFLTEIANCAIANENYKIIQVEAMNIFFEIDSSRFNTNKTLFHDTVFIVLDYYYESVDNKSFDVLEKVLRNTSIFDGSGDEIRCWIDGVLHSKHFDSSIPEFLYNILIRANENLKTYLNRLSELYSGSDYSRDISLIIENLSENSMTVSKSFVKKIYLSPLVLSLVDYLNDHGGDLGKIVKNYIQCVFFNILHLQTSLDPVYSLISSCETFPENVLNYATNWLNKTPSVMKKYKCKMNVQQKFSESFLEGEISAVLKESDTALYPNMKTDLLQMCLFYFSNLLNSDSMTVAHLENVQIFLEHLFEIELCNKKFMELIFYNPEISKKFSILHIIKNEINSKTLATKLIVNLLGKMKCEDYLNDNAFRFYQNKCIRDIQLMIRKPQKYVDYEFSFDTLENFHFNYEDCCTILNSISEMLLKNFENQILKMYFDIIVHTFKKLSEILMTDLTLKQLPDEIIESLLAYVNYLMENRVLETSKFSKYFQNYLARFSDTHARIPEHYFINLINIEEYNEDHANLIYNIFINRKEFLKTVKTNIESIAKKKGLFLCLLEGLVFLKTDLEVFEIFYKHFEPSIIKALNKPQKAGQHFEKHYETLGILLEKCMPENVAKDYVNKVQKYETVEMFHVHLLAVIFHNALKNGIDEKQCHNMLLTYIHLNVQAFKSKIKKDGDNTRLDFFGNTFKKFLETLSICVEDKDFSQICGNETFKLFCKFCLKFGISEIYVYLDVLTILIRLLKKNLSENDMKLILEMMLSHSEFLDVVLGDVIHKKKSSLYLFLEICQNWPQFMERKHLPVLLSAYHGTISEEDRIILQLLNMYEAVGQQTNFHEFKPLLWGRAATSHYSVRQDIQKAIWRQPKVGDVLDILQENIVKHTIKNHPLDFKFQLEDFTKQSCKESPGKIYDLVFFMRLFTNLLVSENVVPTYKFAKSGALSLTIIALSNDDPKMRAAACHVLHKFYNHVEAKTSGKDLALWIRFVEVICKGTASFSDYKLNNFASSYLANMALILTQPTHIMYVPLSHYLTAKADLDLSTIPELYTFLFSNEINHEQHRHFILRILRDGCRTEKDVTAFMKSMAHKLIMEFFSSVVCDSESKHLILDILVAVTNNKVGCRMLLENYSLSVYLKNHVDLLFLSENHKKSWEPLVEKFLKVTDNLRTNAAMPSDVLNKFVDDICMKLKHVM